MRASDPARKSGLDLTDSVYRAIFDTAIDGIAVIDKCGAIRSVNSATEGLFGYAAAELLGRNIKTLMPEPYAGEHVPATHTSRANPEVSWAFRDLNPSIYRL